MYKGFWFKENSKPWCLAKFRTERDALAYVDKRKRSAYIPKNATPERLEEIRKAYCEGLWVEGPNGIRTES